MENYRNAEGNFHFKLCYPELVGKGKGGGYCNEWVQSSNPAVETNITGFKAVSPLAFERDSYNKKWAGLGLDGTSMKASLIDDAPSRTHWWTAIGATRSHRRADTIPGPRPNVVKTVELYVLNEGNYVKTSKISLKDLIVESYRRFL